MVIKHILVPDDMSPKSNRALDTAINLALKYGARLSVVSWVPAAVLPGAPVDGYVLFTAALRIKKLQAKAENYKIPIHFHNIRVKRMIYNVTTRIVNYAKNNDVDLIVMGTRDLKGLKRKILGSVSEDVARDAPCKVIRVK